MLHPQRIKRHDEARGTETALAAMIINHCLLHRVQLTVPATQMFHGHNMTAVHRCQKPDAGVDWLIGQRVTAQASDHYGAGTAIAFGATLLCASKPLVQAQIIQKRVTGGNIGHGYRLVVQQETNFIAVLHGFLPVLQPRILLWSESYKPGGLRQ